MKNIETIIKYLSGEMLPEESKQFLLEASANLALKEELDSVTRIWNEIHKQLELRDGPGSIERELLVAEILAEHDLQFYKQETGTKQETQFRKKIEQTMTSSRESKKRHKKINTGIISMIGMAAAAAIIAFIVILNPPSDLYELSQEYYQPGSDEIFANINSSTRSTAGTAMAFFMQGEYEQAKQICSMEIGKYPDKPELQLLHALSCYESGELSTAEAELKRIIIDDTSKFSRASQWYLAIIYIQSDRKQDAKQVLESILDDAGSYHKQARKLLRKMK